MNTRRHFLAACVASGVAPLIGADARAEGVALKAASHLPSEHVYTQALERFLRLVAEYAGQPVSSALHRNAELGGDKDYFIYMSQGISVDAGIISPAHMSSFSKVAPLMDLPFLFRDVAHWERVVSGDLLKPIAEDIAAKADVMVIGYAGGGTRNIVSSRPGSTLAELSRLKIRVQAAPVHSKIFQALGLAPSVVSYQEVYNAIQSGVIQALENEAAGVEQMKFYEVAPHLIQTRHNITVRPLCFSGKTFRRLPPKVQDAVLRAGREAGTFARTTEVKEDGDKLGRLAKAGRLKLVPFSDHARAAQLAEPVIRAYVKQIGAEALHARIQAA